MPWQQANLYVIYLGWIRSTRDPGWLIRCLTPIGQAIEDSHRIVERLTPDDDSGYTDAVIDEETGVVEQLLGTSFVICQTYITGVVSRFVGLHQFHNHQQPANPLKTTGGTKSEILKFAAKKIAKTQYTGPEIIDAFANYFKHGEEWRQYWEKLTRNAGYTSRIISAAGAERGSTGNLRTGAKVLGNRKYSDTLKFAEIVSDWAKRLESSYLKELGSRGLIKSKAQNS